MIIQTRWLAIGVLVLNVTDIGAAQGRVRRPAAPAVPVGTYTTVSGTIAQFNYNRDALVEGFLLSDKTLVHLPPNAAPLIGPALHAADSVTITGYAITSAAGLRTIEAREVKDRTLGKTYTIPQPGPAAPYSGSGRVQQLNYGADGSVNGFLLDNGTLAELPPYSADNPSSISPGLPVTFTGYARSTLMGRTVVDLQTLSVNGQTLTIQPAARRSGRADAPGAPAPAPPASNRARPGGQMDEPTPPPPPPPQA